MVKALLWAAIVSTAVVVANGCGSGDGGARSPLRFEWRHKDPRTGKTRVIIPGRDGGGTEGWGDRELELAVQELRGETISYLSVSNSTISDRAIASLSQLHLEAVSISMAEITDTGLSELAACETLEGISVIVCPQVSGSGFSAFETHPRLRRVCVNGSMGSVLCGTLSHCRRLQYLDLTGCGIEDKDLLALCKLDNLHTLILCDNNISNDGVATLSKMKSIQALDIKGNGRITDECIKSLVSGQMELAALGIEIAGRPSASGQALSADALAMLLKRFPKIQLYSRVGEKVNDVGLTTGPVQ